MTVLPSPGGPDFDPTDESFVAELANHIFREGPAVAGTAATHAEDLDAVPGHAANAVTDEAETMAGSAYRVNPALTDAIPTGVLPRAAPGVLGIGASSPSSFMTRAAPMGTSMPAEAVEPWRHMAQPWPPVAPQGSVAAVPYTGGPMASEAPAVDALRELEIPRRGPYAPYTPVHVTDAHDVDDGTTFYFLPRRAGAASHFRNDPRPMPSSGARS